jgi:hypothetical protein
MMAAGAMARGEEEDTHLLQLLVPDCRPPRPRLCLRRASPPRGRHHPPLDSSCFTTAGAMAGDREEDTQLLVLPATAPGASTPLVWRSGMGRGAMEE